MSIWQQNINANVSFTHCWIWGISNNYFQLINFLCEMQTQRSLGEPNGQKVKLIGCSCFLTWKYSHNGLLVYKRSIRSQIFQNGEGASPASNLFEGYSTCFERDLWLLRVKSVSSKLHEIFWVEKGLSQCCRILLKNKLKFTLILIGQIHCNKFIPWQKETKLHNWWFRTF